MTAKGDDMAQPRTPAGRPEGGEFAAAHREDAAVTLAAWDLPDDELRAGVASRLPLTSNNRTIDHFVNCRYNKFDLEPPYQRGSVWTTVQRQRLIRSVLMGLPVGAVTTNERPYGGPDSADYVVVDGKQRIEALRAFAANEFPIPAGWVEERFFDGPRPADPTAPITMGQLNEVFRRTFENRPLAELKAEVKSIEAEAELFLLINSTGTSQTAGDLARAADVARGG